MLRDLTINEMEIVSGGAEAGSGDEIIVTGTRNSSGSTYLEDTQFDGTTSAFGGGELGDRCLSCHEASFVTPGKGLMTTSGGTNNVLMWVADIVANPETQVAHILNENISATASNIASAARAIGSAFMTVYNAPPPENRLNYNNL